MGRLIGAVMAFSLAFGINAGATAQSAPASDDSQLVTLAGNTRPEALDHANDRGRVPDSFAMAHMLLVLRRPLDKQAAFDTYVEQLTDRGSPFYHRWLNAEQIGAWYGPAPAAIAAVTRWLVAQGFVVNRVYPSGMLVDFSGDAGRLRRGFHTEIHALDVGGQHHIANMSDPQIPEALAPVVEGIVSLHDFHGHRASHGGPGWTDANCGLGTSDLIPNCYFVTPPDVATIYDLNPLFNTNIAGTGQTIAVVEDSDIYSTNDWTEFRQLFGLSGFTGGTIAQIHPGGSDECEDPGTNGDDFEASLDAEYASATAPNAAIEVVSCRSSVNTWGVTAAVANLIESGTPPPILSASYIWCEADAGTANNKFYSEMWQQAASEGTSVFVSAGDEGGATCDYGKSFATHGRAVNGLASPRYDVAVGGTDFSDTYSHQNSTYWNTTNSGTYGSAKSYVPEMPWDQSCANTMIAHYVTGSSLTYGTKGFCNIAAGANFINTLAGGGGPSSCAVMNAKGLCQGWSKPPWQAIVGNPGDGRRDLPDVSLFSAGPVWGHAFIVCLSDPAHDFGEPCTKFPSGWIYGYGTSFASPMMAGIQALVDQSAGERQGNPDAVLYGLAKTEFGTSGKPTCNASRGNMIAKGCVFRDVTRGDMVVPCQQGSPNCYGKTGTYGVLSVSKANYDPAYVSGVGWDFGTGLGSVDVNNLVKEWPR
ncbi:MAG TPA: S53 family peptidase [Rhizomicrobium sp.]|jgi:subtilase family serine protease